MTRRTSLANLRVLFFFEAPSALSTATHSTAASAIITPLLRPRPAIPAAHRDGRLCRAAEHELEIIERQWRHMTRRTSLANTGEKTMGKMRARSGGFVRLRVIARRAAHARQRGFPPSLNPESGTLHPDECAAGRAKLAVVLALGGALVAWWWRRKTRAHPQHRIQYQCASGDIIYIYVCIYIYIHMYIYIRIYRPAMRDSDATSGQR
jgi:hypothetical protein